MAERRPTVRDVARAAGVSAMSVSRVVNGQPGVGAQTARRIEEAIRTLGFRPNMLATSFRQQRRLSLVGMIVPDPLTPLFTSIAVAVDELVRDDGLMVVTATSRGDVAQERALVNSFIERGADGIMLFSEDRDHRYLEPELERGHPVVFLGSPPVGISCPAVVVDHQGGARRAVEHLAKRGHERIGIVANTASYPGAERLAGHRATVARLRLDADPSLVRNEAHRRERGRRAAASLLDLPNPPTAIFSTSSVFTAGIVDEAHRRSTSLALVGFDDFEAATLVEPPITVVTQNPRVMGRHAARMLLEQMDGKGDRDAVVVVPPRLVPRGSGELPPPNPRTPPSRRAAAGG